MEEPMNPCCRLRYRLDGEKETRELTVHLDTAEGAALPSGETTVTEALSEEATLSLLSTTVHADGLAGSAYRVEITPKAPCVVISCIVEFEHSLDEDSRVFLNGYQSWTDSWELRQTDLMPGLLHVPQKVIDHWVLDGSGDYRFTEYSDKRGRFHGYGYGYLRTGEDITLLGSLNEDAGLTLIRCDCQKNSVTVQREVPVGTLSPRASYELCSFAVLQGPLPLVFDHWFQLMRLKPRPALPLVGYTSWYRHYGEIDEEKLETDLQHTAATLSEVDTKGMARVFQVDDGWCKIGDWGEPSVFRFPTGMEALARQVVETKLEPGLWMAPFVCEKQSQLFDRHHEWLLRSEDGQLVTTGCNWSGAFALDTRNPEVRAYVSQCLRRATEEWGYTLLKLDFLFAACMLPHDGMNRGQLMADALDLIRASVPARTSLLLCGVPLMSAFGRAEYCRIGCDVGPDWDGPKYMRRLHRERASTRNNRANTVGRAQLDRRAFRCDPDVFTLRTDDDMKLTRKQQLEQLGVDCRLGSVLLTSDDMLQWDQQDMAVYREALETLQVRER